MGLPNVTDPSFDSLFSEAAFPVASGGAVSSNGVVAGSKRKCEKDGETTLLPKETVFRTESVAKRVRYSSTRADETPARPAVAEPQKAEEPKVKTNPLNLTDVKAPFTSAEKEFLFNCSEVFADDRFTNLQLNSLESIVGQGMDTINRIEVYKNLQENNLQENLDICQSIAYKSQPHLLGVGVKVINKLEKLLEAYESREVVADDQKLTVKEFKSILSYYKLFYHLKHVKDSIAGYVDLPPRLADLYDICKNAFDCHDKLLEKLPDFKTGTILFHHESRRVPLLSSNGTIYNKGHIAKLVGKRDVKGLLHTGRSFIKDFRSNNIWAMQPAFTGPYMHTQLVYSYKSGVYVSSAMQKFYCKRAGFDDVLMSDIYHLDFTKLLTPKAKQTIDEILKSEGLCQKMFEDALKEVLERNERWFDQPGHMVVDQIRAASSFLSSRSRFVKKRSVDLHKVTSGLFPLKGNLKFNLPVIDRWLMKSEVTLTDRREKGVDLKKKEIFCSEFVARMITQAGYDTENKLREYFRRKLSPERFLELGLNEGVLIESLIPEDCDFRSIHPNALHDIVARIATKQEQPKIVQSIIKQEEFE